MTRRRMSEDIVLQEIRRLAKRKKISATDGNVLALQVALTKMLKRLDIQTLKLAQVWKDRDNMKAAFKTARHGLEAITGKSLWPTGRLLSAQDIARQCLGKI